MALQELLPAHFLSSSIPDESLLTASFARPTTTKKQSTPSPTTSKADLPHVLPPLKGRGSPGFSALNRSFSSPAANSRNGTPPPANPPATPLPAPIGIPTSRRRSPSAAATMSRPPLSSSPTHMPFSVTPTSFVPPPARLGKSATTTPIVIPRPASANGRPTPTLSTSVASSTSQRSTSASPTKRTGPPSPTSVRRGDGIHTVQAPAASSPTSTSPKKVRSWGRFFDFDHMLGALDPNRIAAASCPEPTKTVVFGAETEAGVFVCRKLIAERHYAITALTVDDQCAEAQELRDHGIRVVSVDMDNPGSYAKELAGAKAVYLSSNVLALHAILHQQPEPKRTEIARAADRCQLSKAVQACCRAKVGHVVFRTVACGHEVIENVLTSKEAKGEAGNSISGGRQVPANLATAPNVLEENGIVTTILHTSVPFNRITEWLEDGPKGLVFNVPVPDDTPIPLFAIEQTGDYVLAALKNPKKWAGKEMHAIADVMSPMQIVARLSKLSRQPVDTMHPTREEFLSFESHDRLTLRWDAWAQLVRGEFNASPVGRATRHDVPEEMDLAAWMAQDKDIHKRLKF